MQPPNKPLLRVVSTAPRMVIRRLAREARPNQRLQRTSAAQTAFAPRTLLIRGAVRQTKEERACLSQISSP
jgi:hypothetical protein